LKGECFAGTNFGKILVFFHPVAQLEFIKRAGLGNKLRDASF